MTFKNLNIDQLNNDVKHFSVSTNDSYIESYPEFLKYFESLKKIEKHHLIISSHFVYGWMPTIIYLDLMDIDKVLFLLNAAKTGHELTIKELEILKYCINNSMVGLSKLLHFINPRNYAIWDSNILKYLTGNKSQYGIDKATNYDAYIKEIKKLIQHPDYNDLHFKIERHFDYPITPMRAVEILMFETIRNEKSTAKRLINLDNFEDGQYGEDDSMYSDEDNAFIEASIDRAMKRKRKVEEKEDDISSE